MEKKIVLPGDKILDKKVPMANTFAENDATYAAVIGTMDEEGKYVPLETRYRPFPDDVVVGIITDSRHAGYDVDLNLPHSAFIPAKSIRISFELGDMISGRVEQVNEVGDVDIIEIMKLTKGKVIGFPPAKVPRLIGRKSSMLNLIKQYSGGDVIVGNNGYVWISEKCDIPLVLKAINLVIKKAHTSGLTNAMEEFLKKETGKNMI